MTEKKKILRDHDDDVSRLQMLSNRIRARIKNGAITTRDGREIKSWSLGGNESATFIRTNEGEMVKWC